MIPKSAHCSVDADAAGRFDGGNASREGDERSVREPDSDDGSVPWSSGERSSGSLVGGGIIGFRGRARKRCNAARRDPPPVVPGRWRWRAFPHWRQRHPSSPT